MCCFRSYNLICPKCGCGFCWSVGDYITSAEQLMATCPQCGYKDGNGAFIVSKEVNDLRWFGKPATTENYTDERGLPMPKAENEHIFLRKLNGDWTMYRHNQIRGKVETDFQFKIFIREREFLLQNLRNEYIELMDKPMTDSTVSVALTLLEHSSDPRYRKIMNGRLTETLKKNWLYLIEVDDHTIAAMPNENEIEAVINKYRDDVRACYEWCDKILNVIESKAARYFKDNCRFRLQ